MVSVADFVGPDPARYQVTDELLDRLRIATAGIPGATVQPLRVAVTESDGSDEARRLGDRYGSAIVLWGRYEVDATDVRRINLHIENLGRCRCLPLNATATYRVDASLYTALPSATFKVQVADEMSAVVLLVAGLIAMQQGEHDWALMSLDRAVALDAWPDDLLSSAHLDFFRGVALGGLNRHKEAIEQYSEVLTKNGDSWDAYAARGVSRLHVGDRSEAKDDFSKAIALNPVFADPYNNRGLLEVEEGNWAAAFSDLNRAIALQPEMTEAYVNRGRALRLTGRPNEAIDDYSEALRLTPDKREALNNRALAYLDIGRPDLARRDLERLLKVRPDDPAAYVNLGLAMQDSGDWIGALSAFNKAIALNPRDPVAYTNRAKLYARFGPSYVPDILSDLNRAVELDPSSALAHYHLALFFAGAGRTTEAREHFERVMQLTTDPALRQDVEKLVAQLPGKEDP
jgi:tetratricopeptide (TPR) repeat protein